MYLQGKSLKYEILDSWKGRKGKFIRTFGINSTRNENKWKAPWSSIKENIHTAIGMPGIAYEECDKSGCSLTHVEADTFEENVEKQKPFSKMDIIDYILDEEIESADFIYESTNDEFFEKLERGEAGFVSPLIWPENDGITIDGTEVNKNGVELPVIDAYHWKFVHQAFLDEDPAFGDVAQVKATCDGDNCQIQMLAAKSLSGETTTANDTNLSHLKETPLLYKHKGELHLIAASQCVKDILRKKKEDGITIDDQALAIAFSECGESNKAKSSFKTCTCDAKHNKMSAEETLKKENEDLKAKLKAKEDDHEKEKSFEAKKGRYAKLFADTEDEDREKMVAKLKADDDKDEHKAANEVHEEMKSKKANTEDPEKDDLKAEVKSMQAELAKPKITQILKARAEKVSKDELRTYEKSLLAKSYTEINQIYEDQKPLFADSIKESIIDNTEGFSFNGGGETHSLAGKTLSEIEGDAE